MSTLITGVGLVGTAFAQRALQRGEKIVFFDMAPKMDFLQRKLGNADVTVLKRDIRDLPALIDAMQTHKVDTVLHTAGLIGGAVANPGCTAAFRSTSWAPSTWPRPCASPGSSA